MQGWPIRLMIVDDQAMVPKGMKAFLNECDGGFVVGVDIQLVTQVNPDLALIDLLMPGMDGIETIRRMIAIRTTLNRWRQNDD